MGTASATIRAEESTKRAVRAIAEDFGFNISSIARAFYKQIEREGKIPPSLVEYLEPDKKPLKKTLCAKPAPSPRRTPAEPACPPSRRA